MFLTVRPLYCLVMLRDRMHHIDRSGCNITYYVGLVSRGFHAVYGGEIPQLRDTSVLFRFQN